MATPFDPLGLFEGLKRDLDRLSEGLADGADAVLEAGQSFGAQLRDLDQALVGRPSLPNPVGNPGRPRVIDPDEAVRLYEQGLTNFEIAEMFGVTPLRVSIVLRAAGVRRPRGAPPRISREDVLRLHEDGLSPREIAPQVGASAVRVAQLISEAGLEPHATPMAPTARDLEAARRREQVLELHRQGLTAMEIAQRMDVTPVTVYRILGEEGLRPNLTPEAERARERRGEAIALRQEGVSGAEIARRLGISEPAVVAILRGFRPTPPPSRAREFEERALLVSTWNSSYASVRMATLQLLALVSRVGNQP